MSHAAAMFVIASRCEGEQSGAAGDKEDVLPLADRFTNPYTSSIPQM